LLLQDPQAAPDFVSLPILRVIDFMPRLCLLLFLLSSLLLPSQNDTSLWIFRKAEVQLRHLQKKAFYSTKESERIEGNKEFIEEWDRIVANPAILQYPFDSLKEISVLSPRDKKFKLITWNLHKNDGSHFYFGYLLVRNTKTVKRGFFKRTTTEEYEYFKLLDRSATVKSPENYIGSTDKWFGMLYTQLVECDGYYLLIGWDGNDKLVQRKFIDVLSFRSDGTPVFGKDVFRFPRKNPRRIMFEYSQEVSMSVKYNEKKNEILYSHLEPNQRGSILEGQFQYYGPDGSFDAFVLKRNKWMVVENVEANSDIVPLKNSKKPDPKKQTPVYTPK
jgi:hypothetical protein